MRPYFARVMIALLLVIALVLGGAALRQLQFVLMPLAIAIFIVMLLRPLEQRIFRRLRYRWASISLTMLALLVVLAAFIGAIWWVFWMASFEWPQYRDQLYGQWAQVEGWLRERGIPVQNMAPEDNVERIMGWVGTGLQTTHTVLAGLILILFLIILLLLELDQWREKLKTAAGSGHQRSNLLDIAEVASASMRKYLWVLTIMSALSAITGGAWLWIIGVDLFYLWALLIFVLSFLPIIGSIVAAIPPILMALLQGGWMLGLAAALGLLATEQVIGNFIQPRMQGRNLKISPLVVLLTLLFWGWVWGIIGAFLALPLTVTVVVILAHFKPTRPAALLISDMTRYDSLNEAYLGERSGENPPDE